MDKKIVILTDMYYPHPMAGGICAHQVAKGLQAAGYKVHVICFRRKKEKKEEEFNGIQVHRIRMPLVHRVRDLSERVKNAGLSRIIYNLAIAINRFFKIILLKWYPLMSPVQIIAYVNRARRLDVSAVVAEYFSIESSLAGYWLKRKYAKKLILYNVDSLSNCDPAAGLSLEYVRKKGERWEKKLFRLADGIIVMRSHAPHYASDTFMEFRNRMYVADIPLLEDAGIPPAVNRSSERCCWIYTGTLNFGIRSPEYLIVLLDRLDRNITLHFFSKGNCEEYINRAARESGGRIVQHGHIPKDELEEYYANADILVSIGNSYGTFLPSKTIEYIAHGKPILHLAYQDHDASIPYLKEYGYALILDVKENDPDKHVALIRRFMDVAVRQKIDQGAVREKFRENTPEYTARIIDDILTRIDC